MNVVFLSSLWIAICSAAGWQWWKVRTRALIVRYRFEADPNTDPEDLRLARFRVMAATFWFLAGVAGALVGLLAILDRAPSIQTLLIFAGPTFLAVMGYQQDRHERALMVAAARQAYTQDARPSEPQE